MKRKMGVSLIVLMITIIIMIILAGTITVALNGNGDGIIDNAQNSVIKVDESTVKDMAASAWAKAYARGARTEEELKEGVYKKLEEEKVNVEDYIIKVTTSGVTVKGKSNGWIKDGFTVVKGEQVLEIGDVINYDEGVASYTAGWRVLGADEEGNLLIMSAGDIKSNFDLGSRNTTNSTTINEEALAEAIKDYETGVAQLNSECKPYGYGKGAVGSARSITVEDINAVTGYVPETALWGKDNVYQYGNVVNYKYNGTTYPKYESSVTSGNLSVDHGQGFYYHNGKKVIHITDLTSENIFATLTSNYYYYELSELTTISKETNSKAYSMMFGDDDARYWLASPVVGTDVDYAYFAFLGVWLNQVNGCYMFLSNGLTHGQDYAVRAVVTLSSDITFTGSSDIGWSY